MCVAAPACNGTGRVQGAGSDPLRPRRRRTDRAWCGLPFGLLGNRRIWTRCYGFRGFLGVGGNTRKFIDHWDTMLRTAATIRHGHLPASLLISRLQASAAKTISPERSKIRTAHQTISLLDTSTTKNTGDVSTANSTKAKPSTPYADNLLRNQGQIRRKRPEDQDTQGECLPPHHAIIAWNTTYTAAAPTPQHPEPPSPTITSPTYHPPPTNTSTSTADTTSPTPPRYHPQASSGPKNT